jgi:mannose-6-phosphate isomerase-like protein (cupin superfamily)
MKFPSKKHIQTIAPKGWGKEVHIHNDENYCGKLLELNKGCKCSLHYHINKIETFYILKGKVEITLFYDLDTRVLVLKEGESIDIPRFLAHSFRGLENSTILEISTYDDPSDSVRIQPGDSQKPVTVPLSIERHDEWEKKCKSRLGTNKDDE